MTRKVTSPDDRIEASVGSSPSYVKLMRESFNRADEKALLVSVSYDFSGLGLNGLTTIVNFVAGFDA